LERKLQLLRGELVRWRGAEVGARFGLGRGVRILYPRWLETGDDVTIEDYGYLHCLSSGGVRIGGHTSIARNLMLHCGCTVGDASHGYFEIGEHCYIGPNAVMGASGGIRIGNRVLFGPDVIISSENHQYEDHELEIDCQGTSRRGVTIEHGCWVASRAVILDGITIGMGAVVAAGAVVTRNVPPYAVVAGVPAKVIKQRGKGLRPDAGLVG